MITRVSETRSPARSYNKRLKRVLSHLVVLAGAVVMIYPLLWMISASFKPQDLLFTNTGLFSSQWTIDNFVDGWSALDYPFTLFFMNSLLVCVGAVIGNIISCSMAAYAFARLRFKYSALWFILMLGAIMLPHHTLIV